MKIFKIVIISLGLIILVATIVIYKYKCCMASPPTCGGTSDYSDKKAAKEIKSNDITSFHLEIIDEYRPYDDKLPNGQWYIQLDKIDNQKAKLHFRFKNEYPKNIETVLEVDSSVFSQLQKLIREHQWVKFNGWYKHNTALSCDFHVKVLYSSGESLSFGGKGGVAVRPPGFDADPVLIFFKNLLEKEKPGMFADESGSEEIPEAEEIVDGKTEDYSSRNASKVINSEDIVSFSLDIDSSSWEGEDGISGGRYLIKLEKTGDQAKLNFKLEDRFGEGTKKELSVPLNTLNDLQKLIKKENWAKWNGWHKRDSALDCNFKVKVKYASGEEINFSGEGGSGVIPEGFNPCNVLRLFSKF